MRSGSDLLSLMTCHNISTHKFLAIGQQFNINLTSITGVHWTMTYLLHKLLHVISDTNWDPGFARDTKDTTHLCFMLI